MLVQIAFITSRSIKVCSRIQPSVVINEFIMGYIMNRIISKPKKAEVKYNLSVLNFILIKPFPKVHDYPAGAV